MLFIVNLRRKTIIWWWSRSTTTHNTPRSNRLLVIKKRTKEVFRTSWINFFSLSTFKFSTFHDRRIFFNGILIWIRSSTIRNITIKHFGLHVIEGATWIIKTTDITHPIIHLIIFILPIVLLYRSLHGVSFLLTSVWRCYHVRLVFLWWVLILWWSWFFNNILCLGKMNLIGNGRYGFFQIDLGPFEHWRVPFLIVLIVLLPVHLKFLDFKVFLKHILTNITSIDRWVISLMN